MSEEKIDETLLELQNYTKYHFSTEEKLFEKHNYENSEEHIVLHKAFISKLDNIAHKYKVEKKNINLDLMIFLRTWLVSHILENDKKYVGKI